VNTVMNLRVPKNVGNSLLAGQLSDSQQGLCSMEGLYTRRITFLCVSLLYRASDNSVGPTQKGASVDSPTRRLEGTV
jgi:hypothetical protein